MKPLITIIRELLAEWSEHDTDDDFRMFTSGDVFEAIVQISPEINRKYLDTVIVRMHARNELVQVGSRRTTAVKSSYVFRVERHTLMTMLTDPEVKRQRQMEAADLLESCFRAMRGLERIAA